LASVAVRRYDCRATRHQYTISVQVFLADIDPGTVTVELYAEADSNEGPVMHGMNRDDRKVEATNTFTYSAAVPASRPAAHYTPRLVLRHQRAFVPLEAPFVLWHEAPFWR